MPASSTRGDDEQDQLLRDPVGDHAAEQRGQQHADGAGGRDDRELRRAAADPDDLPDQRDHPDAGGEGAEDERDGQPAVGRRAGTASARAAAAARPTSWARLTADPPGLSPDSVCRCGPTTSTEFIADRSPARPCPSARRPSRSACARAASASGYVETSGRHSPDATFSSARPASPGMPPGSAIIRGPRHQPALIPRPTRSSVVEAGRRARPRTRT